MCVALTNCNTSGSIEDDYEAFFELYQNNSFKKADKALSELISKYPGNFDVIMTQAIVAISKDDFEQAIDIIEKYRFSSKCDYLCKNTLALSYAFAGDTLSAKRIFEEQQQFELVITSTTDFSYKNYFPLDMNSAKEFEADFWYGIDSINRAYPLYIDLKNDFYNVDRTYNFIGAILLRSNRVEDACIYFDNSCQLGNKTACENIRKYCR